MIMLSILSILCNISKYRFAFTIKGKYGACFSIVILVLFVFDLKSYCILRKILNSNRMTSHNIIATRERGFM